MNNYHVFGPLRKEEVRGLQDQVMFEYDLFMALYLEPECPGDCRRCELSRAGLILRNTNPIVPPEALC